MEAHIYKPILGETLNDREDKALEIPHTQKRFMTAGNPMEVKWAKLPYPSNISSVTAYRIKYIRSNLFRFNSRVLYFDLNIKNKLK